MTRRWLLIILVLLLAVCGCQKKNTGQPKKIKSDLADHSITDFHNLGWLGAMSHPLTEAISFPEPDNSEKRVSPGGVVVREVTDGSPAEKSGLQVGDAIVGVGDDWLPIKDDPTLDLIKLIETRVAANEKAIELKILRNGELQTISLSDIPTSLDEGLPNEVARISGLATNGLRQLAKMQNDNGSFGSPSHGVDAQLQMTAIAGLSFLSSGDKQFKENSKSCTSFIADQIDKLIASAKNKIKEQSKPQSTEADSKPPSRAIVMQMPSFELEPLTAAYLMQYLAESDVTMMDQEWMPRLFGIIGSLASSQDESGGWNVLDSAEDNAIDVVGTHTTNQVLLGIGLLERKGMMGQPKLIKKACGFLKHQISARAAGRIDRRIRASLMAGTGVALVAINCQSSDPVLRQAIIEGLERIDERYLSPSLALPGILSWAILARQSGKDEWVSFHASVQFWLASVQRPDGRFKSVPGFNRNPLDIEAHSSDPAWQAAHYCLLLSMQSSKLEKTMGKVTPPMMTARNSSGEKASDAIASDSTKPPNIPAGAQVIQLNLDDLEGGDMQEAIRKKLKEQGIDIGDAELQGLPGSKPGKKKDE